MPIPPHNHPSHLLSRTKKTYSTALTRLILRVEKLEKNVKTGTELVRRARLLGINFEATTSIPVPTASRGWEISTEKSLQYSSKTADVTVNALLVDSRVLSLHQKRFSNLLKTLLEKKFAQLKNLNDIDWGDDPYCVKEYQASSEYYLSSYRQEVKKNICMLNDLIGKICARMYRLVKDRFQTEQLQKVEQEIPLLQITLSNVRVERLEVDHRNEMGYELSQVITLVVPLIPTFVASEGYLIVSSSKTPTVSGQMTDPLAVCSFYSARAIVMKLALFPSDTGHGSIGQATDIFLNLVDSSGTSTRTLVAILETKSGECIHRAACSFLLTPRSRSIAVVAHYLFASRATNAAVTPWSIIRLNLGIVIVMVGRFSVPVVDLVALLVPFLQIPIK
ncbi:hypothetical protein Tco_1125343 [Tanacetum coccineum]|uniref:Uncharacterized protein n=1 Tax=Tanacetum coccineum TaxID=301880 RepID=A0ABQ5JBQ6_9ASTR